MKKKMKMYKVIKEFKNESLVYRLGYNLLNDRVCPGIEIYKDNKLLSKGNWISGNLFIFDAYHSSSYVAGSIGYFLDEMFTWLRQYSEISQNIEREYEKIFILYKLNDFKELRED